MKTYVCIDIGGTAIKHSLLNEKGRLLRQGKLPTQAHLGGPAILEKAVGIVRSYQRPQHQLLGICISTAGMVDTEKGEIFYSAPLIPNYIGTAYKKTMEETFGVPCEVENDVNCAGLAECISGAAKDSALTLCLTVGTGIGGCAVIGKEVLHGFCNSACEIGYMHMGDSDFQTLGATSILVKKVATAKQEPAEQWHGYRIFEEAAKGDAVCTQAIDELIDTLGKGIANICYVLNPQMVVLGGGIMEQGEHLRVRIEDRVKHYLVPVMAERIRVEVARYKNGAGMRGAFYHFLKKHPSRKVIID
ncbi:MAG: ROK family protein [Lachnospiraceae bacterium]|nr:ROK family protein [Lachnospiraceae bacterium]MDY5742572.1 ROK family protein [Lachnospiraceae bacterium]